MKKTNKTFKRFAAITSASLLAACAMAPVFTSMTSYAEGEEVQTTINVTDSQANASKSYNAYKLLIATVDSNAGAYTYAVNPTFRPILAKLASQTIPAEPTEEQLETIDAAILAYIGDLEATTGTSTGEMRTFADAVYNDILKANLTFNEGDKISTSTGSFLNVSQGYYLIAQDTVSGVEGATSSLVMVDTKGDTVLNVTVKKDLPTFNKQIGDICDDAKAITSDWDASIYDWGTDADHDKYASDAVPFRLTATLPSDYASYNHYTLSFHDDLQANVFGEKTIKAVYIADAEGNKIIDIATGDYVVEAGCGATHSENGDGCDFKVTVKDLSAYEDAVAGGKVIVEYTAPFTADTNLGSQGNWNTGKLEYSNNPYNSGYGETDNTTSNTPDVSVVAFTYEVVINKTDSNGNELKGAAFELQKLVNGTYMTVGTYTAGEDTSFTFSGIDDGQYKLIETTTPAGYNGIDPIEFKVVATHSGKQLTELNGTPLVDGAIVLNPTLNETNSKLTAAIQNNSGAELPSTGGIGTTIFYLGGGAMAAIGGIYLISKRRMKKSEE